MKRTSSTVVALCAMLSCAGMARATTITPKLQATEKKVCEERKFIAQGILELCLQVNSGKMILGAMDDSATCTTNFNTALANADTLAASYGTACRYIANGNGTVSDLNTGLMWEQTTSTCTGEATCYTNTYTWCAPNSGETDCDSTPLELPDGTAFTSFLATLNNGAAPYNNGNPSPITGCFANHCDWRLPSIVEFQGIVDLSASGCSSGTSACIDQTTFGPTQSYVYWSATTDDSGHLDGAFTEDFGFGGPASIVKTFGYYVRAVRSGL